MKTCTKGGYGSYCKDCQWVNIRPCNEANRLTWNECDFGVLCNSMMPTAERKLWLRQVLKYVHGPNARVMELTETKLSLPDWDF